MAAPYIPSTDADLLAWAGNFNTLATATPTAYGLTAPQAVTFDGFFDAYSAAYTVAVNPSTRTKPAVAAKNVAKADLIAYARVLALIVQSFPTITNEQLADLGLTVRDLTPTPIPTPTTVPILAIVASSNLAQTLRYADELTPAARKKPFGAIAMEVYSFIGTTVPSGPEACTYRGPATKNPHQLSYLDADGGKLATIYGRWVTRTGLVGPWSLPITMTIPEGITAP